MPGRTQTTTQTQKNKPWKPTRKYLRQNLKDIKSWSKSPASDRAFRPYQKSLVPTFGKFGRQANRQTRDIANWLYGTGNQGPNASTRSPTVPGPNSPVNSNTPVAEGSGASGPSGAGSYTAALQDIISRGGYTADQRNAMDRMGWALGKYEDEWRKTRGPGYAETNLAKLASGELIGKDNPHVADAIAAANQAARENVALNMSKMGRYGSGSHNAATARAIHENTTRALLDQYERDRNRQLQANQMMEAGLASRRNRGLAALSGARGVSGDLYNAGQAATGNLKNAATAMSLPNQMLSGVADQMRQYRAMKLADDQRIALGNRQAPLQRLQALNALYSGTGALGGSTYGQVMTPGSNPFLSALGGGLSGVGGAALTGANPLLGLLLGGGSGFLSAYS